MKSKTPFRLSWQELSWSLYDFSNSAYALIVMTLYYPIYFTTYVFPDSPLHWAVAVSGSIGLTGLVSPLVGAYADRHGRRKGLFLSFSLAAVVGTALLPLSGIIGGYGGLLVFVLVNFSFGTALFLYDSFLVVVPSEHEASTTVSGIGWALGYGGGLACLAVIVAFIDWRVPPGQSGMHLAFIVTAGFFLLFSIVPYRILPPDTPPLEFTDSRNSFQVVLETVRHTWPGKRLVFLFLVAMYFIQDGLTTVVYFTGIYAKQELQFDWSEIMLLIILTNVVGTLTTAPLSALGERIGEVRMLLATVVTWVGIVIAISVLSDPAHFYVIACITGMVIGTTPAVARGFLSKIIPEDRRAELFGFNSFAGRIATFFGPLMFGIFSSLFSMRVALLVAVLPFFALGAVMMVLVGRESNRVSQQERSEG